jgi:hypothetical protein
MIILGSLLYVLGSLAGKRREWERRRKLARRERHRSALAAVLVASRP